MLSRSFLVVFALIMASCINEKDYDIKSLTITPTVAVPLASGTIGVLDLASDVDSVYLKSYSDGLLYFNYTRTYPSREIRSMFDLAPTFSSSASFDLVPGTLPPSSASTDMGNINKEIDFGFSPGKLSEMLMKGGSVNYTISTSPTTNPAIPLQFNVTMTDVVNKTTNQPLRFSAGQGTGSVSMKDYLILMDQNKFDVNLNLVLTPRTSSIFVPVGTKVTIKFTFVNDFSYIKGFFGDQTVQIPTQTIDLTVFNSALDKAKVSFVNPLVKVSLANEYGAPSEFNFTNLIAKKGNTIVPFQLNPAGTVSVASPASLGGSVKTDIEVTNTNAIVAIDPSQVTYGGSLRINKGLLTGSNFMADTSRFKISVIMELPLYGRASNFSVADTLSIDLGKIEQSSISNASLKVKALNQMPLDANIQLYFADANYHITDSLFTPNQTYLVRSSAVTATGDLLSQGVNDQQYELSADKINKIFTTKYLIIRSRFNTTKDNSGASLDVKFKSSYKLKLDVGLLAKLKITTK